MDLIFSLLSDSSIDLIKLSIIAMEAVVMAVVALGLKKTPEQMEADGTSPVIFSILWAELIFAYVLVFVLVFYNPADIKLTPMELIFLMATSLGMSSFSIVMVFRKKKDFLRSAAGYMSGTYIAFISLLTTFLAHPDVPVSINYVQLIGVSTLMIIVFGLLHQYQITRYNFLSSLIGLIGIGAACIVMQVNFAASLDFHVTPLSRLSHVGKNHVWLEVFLCIMAVMALALCAVLGTNPRQHWRRYAVSSGLIAVMSLTVYVANERSVVYSNTYFELARLTESINAQRTELSLKMLQRSSDAGETTTKSAIPSDVFSSLQSYYETWNKIDQLILSPAVGEKVRSVYLAAEQSDGDFENTSLQSEMGAFYRNLKASFGLQQAGVNLSNRDKINFELRLSKLNSAIMSEVHTASDVQDLIKDMALVSGLSIVAFITFGVFLPAHKSTINALDALESEKARIYKLALCAEHTTKGIVLTDSLGHVTWCNDAFSDITGYNLRSLEGRTILQATRNPHADMKELRRVYSDIEGHKPTDIEILACRKDGTDFWLSGSITPVIKNGELSQIVHVFNDVTEEREMRERLAIARSEAEKLALIARTASDGMAIRLADSTLGWMNPAMEQMTGYTQDDLQANPLHELLRGPESNSDDIANMLTSMNLCEPYAGEFLCYRKDGVQYWIEATLTPFYEEDGSYGGFVVTHRDITERKQLELELISSRDELAARVEERTQTIMNQSLELEKALAAERELNRMQTEFVSMASHEFRTPLTIIDGLARRLEKKADHWTPDDIREKAGTMRATVKRMTMLVERTLDASRLSSGRIKLTPETYRLKELVEEVCARQREVASTHTIEMDLDGLPEELFGDARLMDNVFTNVVSNAVKYSGQKKYIKVTGTTEGDFAVLRVKDHGIGIPKSEIEKIFQRFFRASTSTGIPGTGIGLNLVKSLVEMHHGDVSLASEEGEWTEFTVRLPLNSPLNATNSDEASENDAEFSDDETAA